MTRAKRLFRYFSPKASDIFLDQKLWFSAAKDFNDIFEVAPRYDKLLTEQLERRLKIEYAFLPPSVQTDWPTYRKAMAPFARRLLEESFEIYPERCQRNFSERFGIICFCENADSLLMWGHYASCHKGFVVEFDPQHSMFSPNEFGKMEYSDTRPFIEEREYSKLLLTKSPEWSYEVEHRLIKPLSGLPIATRRDGRELRFMHLPMEAVKAVYLGCRMPAEAPDALREILNSLKSPPTQHIKPFLMRRHPANYALVPVPWEEWKAPPPGAAVV